MRLSTTSKIYLLTLLLIFGILLVNKTAFGQSSSPSTVSQERLAVMKRYLTWIDSGKYGEYKKDLGKRTLGEFKSFLSRVVLEDTNCLQETEKEKLSSCKEKIKFEYKLAKKYNRVLKYLHIEEGKPNVCVKADLGVNTALKARAIETGGNVSQKQATVYLCTDSKGQKQLRVPDGSGGLLKLSPEDEKRSELQISDLPPKESLDILIKKLALTTASGEIFASPNPCIIPKGAKVCPEVEVEWDVSDETSDPVEVKTKGGKFIEKSRNGSADILDIGSSGETFILYSLGRKIGEVVVKAVQK